MKQLLEPGMKPSISEELKDFLEDQNDNDVNIGDDEFDKIISNSHLSIQAFGFFRELDLAVFVLNNRRIIQRPLSSYPVLEQALDWELLQYKLSDYGIHWPELDADLSLRGFLLEETMKLVAA